MVDISRGVMWRWLPPCDDDPDDDEVCRVVVFDESRVNGASSVAPPKRISAAETTRGRPLAASSAVHDGVAHRPLTERERERGRPVPLSMDMATDRVEPEKEELGVGPADEPLAEAETAGTSRDGSENDDELSMVWRALKNGFVSAQYSESVRPRPGV